MYLLYIALGIGAFFLIGGSLYAVLKATADNFSDWREKEFPETQKGGLILLLCLMFGGLFAMHMGFRYNEAISGTVGAILFAGCGLGCAVTASPFEILAPVPAAGCIGTLLTLPAMAISTILSVSFGWIFALITLFRGSSGKLRLIALVCFAALGVGCYFAPSTVENLMGQVAQQQADSKAKAEEQLFVGMEDKVRQGLLLQTPIVLELTYEEKQSLTQNEHESVFDLEGCAKLLAEAFSEAYRNKDFDRVIWLLEFLRKNNGTLEFNDHGVSVFFTQDFVDFVAANVKRTCTYKDEFKNKYYEYKVYHNNKYEFDVETSGYYVYVSFVTKWYESNKDNLDYFMYAYLSTPAKRSFTISKNYEKPEPYFLVGESVTYEAR